MAGATADRVFVNGRVHTLCGGWPGRADALAAWQGRIVAIGGRADVAPYIGPATEVVDLAGATVLPGFIETHMHPVMAGQTMSQPQIGTPPCVTIDDVIAAIAAFARTVPAGQPIRPWGYDDSLIRDDRGLTRADLDRASTTHPLVVQHISGHLTYVNSLVFDAAGVTSATPDPPGGEIIRDRDGTPTGELHERAAGLVWGVVPSATPADHRLALAAINDRMVRRGVTSVSDAAVFGDMIAAYQDSVAADELQVRARLFPVWSQLDAFPVHTGFGDDRLRVGALKFIADGSLQGHTGCLCQPYHDRPDLTGTEVIPRDELCELVTRAHRRGFQVAIHANGDRAIDNALDAIAAACADTPRADHRHRIEHAQTLREDQVDRMRDLGVTASVFVSHVWYWGDRHRDRFLGPERAERISPLSSLRARGVPFAMHSDDPVTSVDPLFGIWAAVNRITRDGHLLGGAQRIDVATAIKGFTTDAAYISFEEHDKGTLEVGKLADLVVLADDPFEVDPLTLKDIPVIRTVVGGRDVYVG